MMNFINSFLPSGMVEAFGWMILHSLWQGAIISVVLGLMMIATRKFSAKSRYFIAIVAMLFMPGTAIYTFIRHYAPERAVETVQLNTTGTVVAAGNIQTTENQITSAAQPAADNGISSKLKSYRKYFYRNIPLIVTLWLLGMLVFALKFLGGLAYTQRLKHYRVGPVSDEWQRTFSRLSDMLKLGKAARILQSTLVRVPMVIGYFKPVVLIPVSAFTGLSPKQLEIIILHELAHIVRRDYLINILQSVVEIIFFYHPAVWWMSKIVRTEREHCCDDIAIEASGDSVSFAKALANMQEQILVNENLAMAIGRDSNSLIKRIKRLLKQPNMRTNFTEGFTASCIIFAGIFVMMLNTGSAKFTSGENMQTKTGQFYKDAIGGLGDTVKTVTQKKPEGKSTPEDKLFEMEQKKEVKAAERDREKAEELRKEAEKAQMDAEKAQLKAEMLQQEAKKAQMEARKAAMEAERAREQAEGEKHQSRDSEDPDDVLQEEILQGVEAGLEDMDIDAVVDEAAAGAEAGINEMDLNRIVREAIEGVNYGVEEANAEIIVSEILRGIEAAVNEMDLNVIAGELMSGLRTALEEIDVNRIVEHHVDVRTDHENFRGDRGHLNIISQGVGEWNQWRDENPRIIPDLRGASLSEAKLNSVDLHDALLDNVDMKEAVLDWANLEGVSMRYAILKEATFNGARMMEADFSNADMKEVTLSGQLLRNTVFHGANLKEADLSRADLRDSDLSSANLGEANLVKADLRGANLMGTDLKEAELTGAKLAGAIIDKYTLLPEDFDPGAQGMVFGK
jgi:uncharacterized protein YjbI with pentapeptide repeats/beta-lactamase regulating signal transducer with metallopeptidase domain